MIQFILLRYDKFKNCIEVEDKPLHYNLNTGRLIYKS